MFGSLIRRAEVSADAVVYKALSRIAVAVLFLIAGGFGAAALAIGLSRAFGPVVAYGALAAVFALAGILLATMWSGNGVAVDAPAPAVPEGTAALQARADAEAKMDWGDVTDILKIAAPVAVPALMRMLASRKPFILLAFAAAVYLILNRSEPTADDPEIVRAPAE